MEASLGKKSRLIGEKWVAVSSTTGNGIAHLGISHETMLSKAECHLLGTPVSTVYDITKALKEVSAVT